ncbi:MAG: nascent polypeptide-associated complex protein [Candidatus Aramenus sp.]|jgi:nascent polypeptide-associated complex subunit alpha|nr:nascent polypeptide-associated complex protein [Candidatus Aramenus sp.]
MKIKPKDLKNLERLGIKAENIDAVRVTIETREGKRIVIEEPTVTKTVAMGQEAIVVMGGKAREEEVKERESGAEVNEDDVKFVAEQTGKSLEEARRALIEANGDIAQAIMNLTKEQSS